MARSRPREQNEKALRRARSLRVGDDRPAIATARRRYASWVTLIADNDPRIVKSGRRSTGAAETEERPATALLELRRSSNGARLGLAAIEQATSLDEVKRLAQVTRLDAGRILAEMIRPATRPA